MVNVSGFHVDPGYRGRLKFAVYNAGSRAVILDQGQRVFMIWFAGLDHPDDNPYQERPAAGTAITADDVLRIQGAVASPAELKKQLDELKADLDKKFHASEQTRMSNRNILMLLLGIVTTFTINVVKPYFGSANDFGPRPPAQKAPDRNAETTK